MHKTGDSRHQKEANKQILYRNHLLLTFKNLEKGSEKNCKDKKKICLSLSDVLKTSLQLIYQKELFKIIGNNKAKILEDVSVCFKFDLLINIDSYLKKFLW